MFGIARNDFFSQIYSEKSQINEFFPPKKCPFLPKNPFFAKLMVWEAFSRFGKWRNRFLGAKNGGICSFRQKNLTFFYPSLKCTPPLRGTPKNFLIFYSHHHLQR